jgi:hypothetical protein
MKCVGILQIAALRHLQQVGFHYFLMSRWQVSAISPGTTAERRRKSFDEVDV